KLSMGNISSPTFEEDYTVDELRNCTNLVKKTGGTTSLNHGRAPNEANEAGTTTTTTGTPWEAPVHDDAGNMTTIPQPKALASGESETLDSRGRPEATPQP